MVRRKEKSIKDGGYPSFFITQVHAQEKIAVTKGATQKDKTKTQKDNKNY